MFRRNQFEDLGSSAGVIIATIIGSILWVMIIAAILHWVSH